MSTPACENWHLLLQADLDGELDAGGAAEVAAHLATCPDCATLQQALAATSRRIRREATRHQAPLALRRRIAGQRAAARWAPRRFWPGFATGLALAACVALLFVPRQPADLAGQIVDAHTRALQPGHLLDVVSTDRHTVKPWFAGRIDFSPPVRDFAAAGFPLKGARLEIVGGHSAAALVYAHGPHLIDLLVWPDAAPNVPVSSGSRKGYLYAAWQQDGMAFWAVSDVAAGELNRFVGLWQITPASSRENADSPLPAAPDR